MTMMSFCERAEDERLDYAANTEWSARVPLPRRNEKFTYFVARKKSSYEYQMTAVVLQPLKICLNEIVSRLIQ